VDAATADLPFPELAATTDVGVGATREVEWDDEVELVVVAEWPEEVVVEVRDRDSDWTPTPDDDCVGRVWD
jgi:hypothetical protein